MGNTLPPLPSANVLPSETWSKAFVFGSSAEECSGNGYIFTAGVGQNYCICNEKWSGLSDFVNAAGVQCQINIWVVNSLWVILMSITALFLLQLVPKTIIFYKKHEETRVKLAKVGKKFPITSDSNLMILFIGIFIVCAFNLIVGALRLSGTYRRLGTDVALSICWFIGRSGLYLGGALQQPGYTSMILKSESASKEVIDRGTKIGYFISTFAICNGFWVIPILATEGKDIVLSRVCFVLFCFGQLFVMIGLASQGYFVKKKLYALLSKTIALSVGKPNHDKIVLIRELMVKNQNKIVYQSVFQMAVYFSFIVGPPMWIVHDYLLPISWISPVVMVKQTLDAAFADEKKYKKLETQYNSAEKISGQTKDGKNIIAPHVARNNEVASDGNSFVDYTSTPRAGGRPGDFDSDYRPAPPTAFESKDVTSVVLVDENVDELLATGNNWNHLRKEEKKKKGERIDEEPESP